MRYVVYFSEKIDGQDSDHKESDLPEYYRNVSVSDIGLDPMYHLAVPIYNEKNGYHFWTPEHLKEISETGATMIYDKARSKFPARNADLSDYQKNVIRMAAAYASFNPDLRASAIEAAAGYDRFKDPEDRMIPCVTSLHDTIEKVKSGNYSSEEEKEALLDQAKRLQGKLNRLVYHEWIRLSSPEADPRLQIDGKVTLSD